MSSEEIFDFALSASRKRLLASAHLADSEIGTRLCWEYIKEPAVNTGVDLRQAVVIRRSEIGPKLLHHQA
jgi:hypothetical protein